MSSDAFFLQSSLAVARPFLVDFALSHVRPSPFLLLPLLSCFAVLVSTMTGPALAMTGAADQVATNSLLDFRMMHATFAHDASYSIPMVVLLRNTPTRSAGTPW
jgi:hypothetical protein